MRAIRRNLSIPAGGHPDAVEPYKCSTQSSLGMTVLTRITEENISKWLRNRSKSTFSKTRLVAMHLAWDSGGKAR